MKPCKNCIKIATSDVMFQEEITEKAGQLPFPAQVKMISKTTQTDEWMDNTYRQMELDNMKTKYPSQITACVCWGGGGGA